MAVDKSIELILFEKIKTAIEEVTEIKDVVAWNEQSAQELNERPYLYPYVGIEIQTSWDPAEAANDDYYLTQPQKNAVSTVTLHIIFVTLADETVSFIRDKAICHEVHRAVNCLEYAAGDGKFTSLDLTQTEMNTDHGRVYDYTYTYTSYVTECGVEETKESVEVDDITQTRE